MIFAKFAKTAVRFAGENASPILAGIAVVGVISTVVMAVKAAPKAKDILEEREEDLMLAKKKEEPEDLKRVVRELNFEYFKKLAPVVAPVVISTVLTIACIVGSTAAGLRRQAALAAACNLSENAFDRVWTKTKEVVGEEKAKEIQDAVLDDEVKYATDSEYPTVGYGEVLVLEPTQHKYVSISKDKLTVLEKEIELELEKFDFYTLSNAYDFMKLPNTIFGDVTGWSTEDGDRKISIYLRPSSTPDDRPCFTMSYVPAPHVI